MSTDNEKGPEILKQEPTVISMQKLGWPYDKHYDVLYSDGTIKRVKVTDDKSKKTFFSEL